MRTSLSERDCFVFSTGRSASTAIYKYLNAAGSLGLPSLKEPHYWCDILNYEGTYDLIKSIYIEKDADYWNLYSKSKFILDASCGYFFYLDDVIQKLALSRQSPRAIFLYREPLSRAESWFNERKKKELTDAADVLEDMTRKVNPDLWWEHYYDNVFYHSGYKKLQANFDQVLSINYHYFAKHPKEVISILFDYIEVKPTGLSSLDFAPINSSQEAKAITFLHEYPWLKRLVRLLPGSVKQQLWRQYLGRISSAKIDTCKKNKIKELLPVSMIEYTKFREYIKCQDIHHYHR